MSADASKAVFLSYASQDAEAAKRICDALRAAGVEVWFDQSELVGGDQWDQKIRKQIKECALLIPVISAATQARTEGYFRLEWRLADQRTHLMAKDRPFLLPVVIDETRDADARVPDSFTEVQWTRLPLRQAQGFQPDGEAMTAFAQRVEKLLSGSEEAGRPHPVQRGEPTMSPVRRGPSKLWWALPIFGMTMALILLVRERRLEPATVLTAPGAPATPAGRTIARVRAMLGAIDVTRSELDLASDLLEQAVKADPADARLFATWALLDCRYLTETFDRSPGRFDAARRHVAQAVSLDGADPEVRFARAVTMKRVNGDEATRAEAMALLESVRTQLPDDPRVLGELGWATDWTDQGLAKAEDWWAQQAKLPGQAAAAAFYRALRRAYVGDLRTSYPAFVEADALGKSTKVKLWKAYLEVTWLGDLAAAKRTMAEVPAEAFVEDMAASARYTVAYWSRDYEEALAASRAVPREFMQSNAGVISTGYLRGVALARLGRSAAAENEWRAALAATERRLATEPSDHSLLLAKGLLLVALGDKPAALQVRRTAIELHGENIGEWSEDDLAAELLPPEEAIARLQDQARRGTGLVTAAVLRHNPYYDRFRENPRFVALQTEADANPRLSPAAKVSPAGEVRTIERKSQPALVPSPQLVADAKSVAVLAFTNLSDDKANEYFSDGSSEELLNVLAKVPGLKVSARTSAFYFKGKDTPIPEIAQKLGVAYVVEGSVRKQGDKVRITAQLIKAADGFHVWSDTFTRDLKDVFAVQDEIAGLIADNLSLKLGMRSAVATASVSPEAFELYVQGRQAWSLRTNAGFDLAEQLLNRSLALAPDFARAHAALADVAVLRALVGASIGRYDQRNSPEQTELVARIRRVLALDPDLAEAHATLGFTLKYGWEFAEGERELRRAVALNPNYATGHHWLGGLLLCTGQMDDALAELKLASELDPLSSRILDNYGGALYAAGRYREALAVQNRALALQSNSTQALAGKAWTLLALGRTGEAVALVRQLPSGNSEAKVGILAQAGLKTEAEAVFAQLEAKERTWGMLLVLGRPDEALAALENSASITTGGANDLFFDPITDTIRGDPRFAKCLATVGWTEAHARAQAWRKAHPPEKPGAAK